MTAPEMTFLGCINAAQARDWQEGQYVQCGPAKGWVHFCANFVPLWLDCLAPEFGLPQIGGSACLIKGTGRPKHVILWKSAASGKPTFDQTHMHLRYQALAWYLTVHAREWVCSGSGMRATGATIDMRKHTATDPPVILTFDPDRVKVLALRAAQTLQILNPPLHRLSDNDAKVGSSILFPTDSTVNDELSTVDPEPT